jgi:hypothetical protein
MSPRSITNRAARTGGIPIGGTMKALWDSIVRTIVPIAVGAVVSFFVTRGIELDPEFEGALFLVITGAFQGVYYIAVRLFETYISPKFGVLLGLAKAPEYGAKTGGPVQVTQNIFPAVGMSEERIARVAAEKIKFANGRGA